MTEKPKKFLRLKQVKERIPLSTSTIYDLMARGEFCRPHSIGKRAKAWLEEDIDREVEKRLQGGGASNA